LDEDAGDSQKNEKSDDRRPLWMRTLRSTIDEWLKVLPQSLSLLTRTAESVKNPLFRFFERETEIASKLLKKIRADLNDLIQVCEGNLKLTNYTRGLVTSLTKGMIPKEWKKYPVPASVSINMWIKDLAARIKQLEDIRKNQRLWKNQPLVGWSLYS